MTKPKNKPELLTIKNIEHIEMAIKNISKFQPWYKDDLIDKFRLTCKAAAKGRER